MKQSYLCIFYGESDPAGFSSFVPDIPACHSHGDDMPHARAMIRECMDLCLEGAIEDGEPFPEPKMTTFAEALEWFRELASYELEGETEEDRAFNEEDLHIEMIEVEIPVAQVSTR